MLFKLSLHMNMFAGIAQGRQPKYAYGQYFC